jgi:tetratricopeptide (TPR) repeat protein
MPNDPDLFFNLGYAYWLDKDTPGAINWLREAVRRDPSDDAAHYVLGVALQSSGNTAEAAREKELARQLSSATAEWEAKQVGVNAVPRGLERLKTDIDVSQTLRAGGSCRGRRATRPARGGRVSPRSRESDSTKASATRKRLRAEAYGLPRAVRERCAPAAGQDLHAQRPDAGRDRRAEDRGLERPANTEAKELLARLSP